MSEHASWMVVYTTHNSGEAHIVSGRLQSHGIGAWVHQEPFGSAMGITVGRLGEVRVLVPDGDYDRAVAILEGDEVDELPADADQVVFGDDEAYPDDADE